MSDRVRELAKRYGSSARGRSMIDMTILAVASVAARLAVQLALGFYVEPEAWEYDTLARNVLAGAGYVIGHDGTEHLAFTFPLYPLLLAGTYALFGLSPVGVGLLQAGLGGGLTVLTYLFALPLGRRVAIVASLGVAAHPGLLIYAAKIHALNLHAVLAMATALLARAAWERPDGRRAVLAGVGSGLAALERTTLVPALGLAIAIGGWRRRGFARAVPLGLAWLLLTAVISAPWIARNVAVVGAPVFTTTGNEALWRGNNAQASGGNLTLDGRPMLEAVPEMHERIFGRPELEQDETFRDAALEYMAQDPAATIQRTLAKLYYFWWFGPTAGLLYPASWTLAYTSYYAILLVLALAGLVRMISTRAGPSLAAIALIVLPLSLMQAVYYVEGRHRWAIEPLLLVAAAVGLETLLRLRPGLPRDAQDGRAEGRSPA